MKIYEALDWATDCLKQKGIVSSRVEAEIVLEDLLSLKKWQLYLEPHHHLPPGKLRRFKHLIQRRANLEPLAYILAKKCFMEWEFKVSRDVLIPRWDTELLVEESIKLCPTEPIIVDLCTGSGAIIISLIKLLGGIGFGLDNSKKAIKLARGNALLLDVADKITFLCGYLFTPIESSGLEQKVDLIVSNPPYIPSQEIKSLPEEVLWEPWQALDGGKDGLTFYREIIPAACYYLKEGGWLTLEMGLGQAEAVKGIISGCQAFEPILIKRDSEQIERVIMARRKKER